MILIMYFIIDGKVFGLCVDRVFVDFCLIDRKWECEVYILFLIECYIFKVKVCFFGYELNNSFGKEVKKIL